MTATRDRIIEAASTLFYREGTKSVGMDAIASKAGLTKRSLYYHFASKDEIIEAYLAQRDQPDLDAFDAWFAAAEGETAAKIRALFTHLARLAKSPKWKGCAFLRTAAELVALPGHPAVTAAKDHKRRFEHWLAGKLQMAGIAEAVALSRQIRLLLDGAFSVVLLHRDPSYFDLAGAAAEALVRMHASNAQASIVSDRKPSS